MIPENRANQLLTEVGVTSLPVNPMALASNLGVEIKEMQLGRVCDGFLLVQDHQAFIGINSDILSAKRRSYTVAHEIGHLCMDVSGEPNQKIECQPIGIGSYSKALPLIEVRANKFASELLLPKGLVSNLILERSLGWNSIDEISDLADVSRTATARKFVELTDEACALVVSEGGQIKWFVASPSFGLKIDMDSRLLLPGCPADLAFKKSNFPNEFIQVPTSAWAVVKSMQIKNESIQEWSLPLNQYGQVLTLLWDDQGIGDIDEEFISVDEDKSDDFDPRYGWETPTFGRKRR